MKWDGLIWRREPGLEELNELLDGNMGAHLGIRVTQAGKDFLEATMPVDSRTRQPFGLLHGGASLALAETLGSVAAHLVLDPERQAAVGLEINGNHLRAVREGIVTGRVQPLHVGRTTHVWQTHIRDEDDRLVCVSRLTVAVIDRSR